MLAEGAAGAVDRIFRGEADGGDALAEGGQGCFAGADQSGFLAVGVGPDDLEVRRRAEALVPGAGGEDDDIAHGDMEFLTLFPAEEQGGIAPGDAEDFVVVRVEMVVVIHSPAPARAPAVGRKTGLEPGGPRLLSARSPSLAQRSRWY